MRRLLWLLAALCIVVTLLSPLPAAAADASVRPAPGSPTNAPALENGGYSGVVRLLVISRCLLPSGASDPRRTGLAACPGTGWVRHLHLPAVFRGDQHAEPRPDLGPPVPDGVPRSADVPILMYHHIGEVPPGTDSIRRGLTVSEGDFRAQMAYLKDAGYHPVTLSALVTYLVQGSPLPERPVVITFDDGYRDNYEVALPVLQDLGFVSTVFLVTAPIDEGSSDFVSWDHVKEMHRAGVEIGAHSYTHPDLSGQTVDYQVWQILGSKEAIEERTGEPVRFFAYPSGAYDDTTIKVVQSAGFWGAVTVEAGCRHTDATLWTLKRLRVQPYDGVGGLAAKLDECLSP